MKASALTFVGGAGPRRRLRDSRGSALLVVLILAFVMAGALAAVLTYMNRASQLEKRSNLRLEATYAAEYAMEKAYEELRTQIAQLNRPGIAQTTAVTNLTTAPVDLFGTDLGYTWKTYLTVPTEKGVVVGEHTNATAAQGTYRYLTAVEFERVVPTMAEPIRANFQREWVYTFRPLFQFAIFYDANMELFPGANFVVGGRVHSNGTIYTGTTASITFAQAVTYVNGMSNNYHPDDPRSQGALNGPVTYSQGSRASVRENPPGSMTMDTADANHNNDGARELIEIPNSWQTDPSSGERLYNQAGLKVLVNTTGATVSSPSAISVPANSRVLMTQDGTIIPPADPLGAYINGMFGSATVRDYRENASVTTTTVDVSRVTSRYNAGGLPKKIPSTTKWPNNASVPATLRDKAIPAELQGKDLWNGIVYVTDITDSASHPVGIKIVNGASLPDGSKASSPSAGLTIVSENAAYIVGDYNTGGTPPVNSGTNLAAANKAAGYTVQPAAVIADAVTVLSSNWDGEGYNSESSLSERTPANTTINTALISGIVPTSSAAYSGGVENYIRLLENWSSKRLTYYGSIINLYASQQATAPWLTTGNYYNAPVRNWYFDTQFRDPNRLPPGTPTLRALQRGQWVQLQ